MKDIEVDEIGRLSGGGGQMPPKFGICTKERAHTSLLCDLRGRHPWEQYELGCATGWVKTQIPDGSRLIGTAKARTGLERDWKKWGRMYAGGRVSGQRGLRKAERW